MSPTSYQAAPPRNTRIAMSLRVGQLSGQFIWVDVVGDDDEGGLPRLDQVGDVVEAEFHDDGFFLAVGGRGADGRGQQG